MFSNDVETKHFIKFDLVLVVFPDTCFSSHVIDLHPFEASNAYDKEHVEVQKVLCKSPSLMLWVGAGVQQDKTDQHEPNSQS